MPTSSEEEKAEPQTTWRGDQPASIVGSFGAGPHANASFS
jgi:hypothetical protein